MSLFDVREFVALCEAENAEKKNGILSRLKNKIYDYDTRVGKWMDKREIDNQRKWNEWANRFEKNHPKIADWINRNPHKAMLLTYLGTAGAVVGGAKAITYTGGKIGDLTRKGVDYYRNRKK